MESGKITTPSIPAGLAHAEESTDTTLHWHIHHTYPGMAVNGLGRRDAQVRFDSSLRIKYFTCILHNRVSEGTHVAG